MRRMPARGSVAHRSDAVQHALSARSRFRWSDTERGIGQPSPIHASRTRRTTAFAQATTRGPNAYLREKPVRRIRCALRTHPARHFRTGPIHATRQRHHNHSAGMPVPPNPGMPRIPEIDSRYSSRPRGGIFFARDSPFTRASSPSMSTLPFARRGRIEAASLSPDERRDSAAPVFGRAAASRRRMQARRPAAPDSRVRGRPASCTRRT